MSDPPRHKPPSDAPFLAGMAILVSAYLLLILGMIVANLGYVSSRTFAAMFARPEIRYSIKLSLIASLLAAVFSVWIAAPAGYLLSRFSFRGKSILDALLDVPIVLPPLVVGLSLLILFRSAPFAALGLDESVIFTPKAVVIAMFTVVCAFACRIMRTTFDDIPARREKIAFTLGCSRSQAFWRIALPEARNGLLASATVAWARALGEFGPILIFAGTTRLRTEVLPSTVFLEWSAGNLQGAAAVSLIMIACSLSVLIAFRMMSGASGAAPERARR